MQDKPNIILIFPDQWRWDCLSRLGHPVVRTPFLDQVAAEGVTFTRAYSPCPSCIAARASLMTGQHPWNHGRLGYRDGVPWRYRRTLPGELRDGGYQTMVAGKTHFYPQRAGLGFEQLRLYETQVHDDEASDYHIWLRKETGGAYTDLSRDIDPNALLCCPWAHPEHRHPNTWTTDAALDMLQLRDPLRPFFLQISFQRPHTPIDPPIDYYNRFKDCELPPVPVGDWAEDNTDPEWRVDAISGVLDERQLADARRGYYAQLAHIDYQVGRLLRRLKTGGLLQTTWIIFCSDHGEMLGDHHQFRKSSPFEASAAIPMVVRPPGPWGRPDGRISEKPTLLTDILPTCLDLAGLETPDGVDGRSLMPILDGHQAPWRQYLHIEHAPAWQSVTDGRRKYIWNSETGRDFFFDLEEDPNERHNLADSHPEAPIWRDRLVGILAPREDGKVVDGRLVAGSATPQVREHLMP